MRRQFLFPVDSFPHN